MQIPSDIVDFLNQQGYVIVSTIDPDGYIHCSAKGIVRIEGSKIYLVDIYLLHTFQNLQKNSLITITAVDEQRFKGYCLKGRAQILAKKDLDKEFTRQWDEKVVKRISARLIKNVQGEKQASFHPESRFLGPQYVIVMLVDSIIDLTPPHLKKPPR